MDGFEFLDVVRSDKSLSDIVIFVLTTSSRDADRAASYQQHTAGYMVKSAVGPQFSKLATLMNTYLQAVQLPHCTA